MEQIDTEKLKIYQPFINPGQSQFNLLYSKTEYALF